MTSTCVRSVPPSVWPETGLDYRRRGAGHEHRAGEPGLHGNPAIHGKLVMARIRRPATGQGLRALGTAGRQEPLARLCVEERQRPVQGFRTRQGAQPHGEQARKHVEEAARGSQAKAVSTRPAAGTPAPTTARPAPVRAQGTAPLPQYTDYRPGTVPYRIGDDRESPGYFIPDEALKVFDEEFDYRETANSRELTDRAVALFVGMMSAQAAPSGGGGGGSSDLPWGRREDEDDREWARRCAREAERMIGRKPKTGRKR